MMLRRMAFAALAAGLAVLAALLVPFEWYPPAWQTRLVVWFGPGEYRSPPPSVQPAAAETQEARCPDDLLGWREAQVIDGVPVRASHACSPDNPYAVAAFVKGTNNVSDATLMQSRLAPTAVTKGRDLDGDGDPDEIHIRLQVVELNGGSPDIDQPVTTFPIAPGIQPGFWVFAPETFGMATVNFESLEAMPLLRVPSPVIRVEQGDRVQLTLENGHYMPHTIHLHGVDHPFLDANGEGNDGPPQTSEMPVMPGASRTYEMQPRQPGTMFYHCHVQPQIHILMGLNGMFVVEENRPDNWLQTMNVGAGEVRHPSQAVLENYDSEHDLHYMDADRQLHDLIQRHNDQRLTIEQMHRRYDITDGTTDYYMLNGRSFPYTFRESLVVAQADQRIKLRVLNGGQHGIALHTHGHKVRITHYDGVEHPEPAQITRDVVWVAPAQRVDLALRTVNDGLHSYGPGIWLMHDHREVGVTTDGISPGGNVSAIVYEQFLGEDGFPAVRGVSWDKYFTPDYYAARVPIWWEYDPFGGISEVLRTDARVVRLAALGLVVMLCLLALSQALAPRRR